MRRFSRIAVFAMMVCTAWTTTAGIAAGAPAPTTKPALPATTEELQGKVLPEISVDSVSLKDFLDFVGEIVPGFQFVIVRDPNVPNDYPTLPPMKLRKVTFGQVLAILQEAVPGIDVHPIESETGPAIYIFKISGQGGNGVDPQAPTVLTALKVYRLAEAVDQVYSRHVPPMRPELNLSGAVDAKAHETYQQAVAAARKEALDSVLSLVKAALAQSGDSVAPTIQVHEETQTLLLRGTTTQVYAVQTALASLTPDAVLAPMKEKLADAEHQYEQEAAKAAEESARHAAEIQAARAEADTLHQEMLKLQIAMGQMKAELDMSRKMAESSVDKAADEAARRNAELQKTRQELETMTRELQKAQDDLKAKRQP